MTEEEEYEYKKFLQGKDHFNLDCYYCLAERDCNDAHTWDTGEKKCKYFRGA